MWNFQSLHCLLLLKDSEKVNKNNSVCYYLYNYACAVRMLWIIFIFERHRDLECLYLSFPVSWIITISALLCCFKRQIDEMNASGIRAFYVSRNTELFLEYTHEKMKKRFGDHMGREISLMFDDEAYMGQWTDGFEMFFGEKCGYDIGEFMPYIVGEVEPETHLLRPGTDR